MIFKILSKELNLKYYFSTRKDGDMRDATKRSNFFKLKNILDRNTVSAKLSHGTNISEINDKSISPTSDAMMTQKSGICLVMTVADCVPIIYWDKNKKILAISHNGWRGTIAGLTTKVLDKMKNEYGSKPDDVLIGIGPSICQKHYEIGHDVWNKIPKRFKVFARPLKNRKWLFDLWSVNMQQAIEAGVPTKNIEVSKKCTFEDQDYFSHRLEGERAGRFIFASMIYNV